jgi:hypothetical protein
MRAIERVRAIQAITQKMRKTMSFDDVRIFFNEENIPQSNPDYFDENNYDISDWIRNYLESCTPPKLIDIAEQLDLELTIVDQRSTKLGDSSYWMANHLRLFISHVHTKQQQAAQLKDCLLKYGISSFVAHDDIDVSAEWREEILRALMSMDVLAALVSEDFNSSKWTDQEVGVAIARDTAIIPINIGCPPYGFLEQYQSFTAKNQYPPTVAEAIFGTIAKNPKTKEPLIGCLKKLLLTSNDSKIAIERINILDRIPSISSNHWEEIRNKIASNNHLVDDALFLEKFNEYLKKYKLEPIEAKVSISWGSDDDIPF